MTSAQTFVGGKFQAVERGAFDKDAAPVFPASTPTAPMRDFVWGSLLKLGVVSFSKWRDELPRN